VFHSFGALYEKALTHILIEFTTRLAREREREPAERRERAGMDGVIKSQMYLEPSHVLLYRLKSEFSNQYVAELEANAVAGAQV